MKTTAEYRFHLDHEDKVPIGRQIVNAVVKDIERGVLVKDFHLPSINKLSDKYAISRDTIEHAYSQLKKVGYITSVPGKGYFVNGKPESKLKILLVFNKLSSYKRIVYNRFIESLGDAATVDLQIHHYDPRLLKEIIDSNLGKYHYYVIMPHFYHSVTSNDIIQILKNIPPGELVLLDKYLPELEDKCLSVHQDFREDINEALTSAIDLIDKYKSLKIVYSDGNSHPLEIIEGTTKFCETTGKDFSIIKNAESEELKPATVYIVLTESDLAHLLKKVRKSGYILGKEIGIISFNETIFKELLDVTVITTDFNQMGQSLADLILKKQTGQIKNPFTITRRNSL